MGKLTLNGVVFNLLLPYYIRWFRTDIDTANREVCLFIIELGDLVIPYVIPAVIWFQTLTQEVSVRLSLCPIYLF